jgi:hypothetical protein
LENDTGLPVRKSRYHGPVHVVLWSCDVMSTLGSFTKDLPIVTMYAPIRRRHGISAVAALLAQTISNRGRNVD